MFFWVVTRFHLSFMETYLYSYILILTQDSEANNSRGSGLAYFLLLTIRVDYQSKEEVVSQQFLASSHQTAGLRTSKLDDYTIPHLRLPLIETHTHTHTHTNTHTHTHTYLLFSHMVFYCTFCTSCLFVYLLECGPFYSVD